MKAVPSALSRRLQGSIAYRAGDGAQVGRETFDLCSHPGGHILRALCVLDDVDLLRDVTLSLAHDWRPQEGYCRVTRGGRTEGVLWCRVEPDGVRVDSSIAGEAAPQQFIPTEAPLPYLGLHPLQGDALIVEQRGTDDPGRFRPIATVTNSVSPNGDEAIGGRLMTIDAAYVGAEEIEVAAGRFAARRYALRWREDWPAADLWVRAQDNLFLLMRWSLIETWYELAEWSEA
ncbi:hypothetical protein LK533_07615 [Sphingomonas sp. PL-96]|uniref:hypothetical protein n=1 Tax=Sphingomonas sp. PL-96 TaxID=2887201 RepID=UPI001E4193A8|nr:hypothetical protein [Sphingomonas sp. PL-96]MCC2976541.1 hypothetical protein [Sphingomonas sp. PL-96]